MDLTQLRLHQWMKLPMVVVDASPLSDPILEQLSGLLNPLPESNQYGIDVYVECLSSLQSLLNLPNE